MINDELVKKYLKTYSSYQVKQTQFL